MAQVAQSSTSSDTSGTKSTIGTIGTTATFTGTTDPGRAISIALSHPKPKCLLGAPGGPRLLSFADGAHGGAAFFLFANRSWPVSLMPFLLGPDRLLKAMCDTYMNEKGST